MTYLISFTDSLRAGDIVAIINALSLPTLAAPTVVSDNVGSATLSFSRALLDSEITTIRAACQAAKFAFTAQT